MKNTLIIFLLLVASVSWGQDTATQVFKISKIYATAAGRTGDTIGRLELLDSGRIAIHGCRGCKVLGFQLMVKIQPTALHDSEIKDTLAPQNDATVQNDTTLGNNKGDYNAGYSSFVQYARKVPSDPRGYVDSIQANAILFSKNDLFTPAMKDYIENNSYTINTYYIEIDNIRIVTPEKEKMTLNKICLFLK